MRVATKRYSVGLHMWINEEHGHFMGKGRVYLLENIKNTGSISKGARAMKMSYRQAWQMVEDMNKRSNKPLVEKILGGKGGGGAYVTETGEKAIQLYYRIEKEITKFSGELTKIINL